MCIIVAKPAGIPFPVRKTLKTCWDANDHGAGFMYTENDKVVISKGFLTFKTFYKYYRSLKLDESTPVVFHFRIGTSGGLDGTATHPFPVSSQVEDIESMDLSTDLGVAHNGILTIDHPVNFSDTQWFIMTTLASQYVRKGIKRGDKTISELLKNYIGVANKLAFMDDKGIITTVGNGWIHDSGIMYSNSGYSDTYTSNYYSSYGSAGKSTRGYTVYDSATQTDKLDLRIIADICTDCTTTDSDECDLCDLSQVWAKCTDCYTVTCAECETYDIYLSYLTTI
jgi:predicted glutamine amidotransferase